MAEQFLANELLSANKFLYPLQCLMWDPVVFLLLG